MTVDEVFADFEKGFPRRKFSAGLLVAFIDFMGLVVWSLLRMASRQSREEEAAERVRYQEWLEAKRRYAEREAEWRKYHGRKEA